MFINRRHLVVLLLGIIAVALGVSVAWAGDMKPGGSNKLPDRYIVVLKKGAGKPAGVARAHGLTADKVFNHALNGFSAAIPAQTLARVLGDASVDYVEPDGRVWALQAGGKKKPGGHPGSGSTTRSPQVVPPGVTRVGGPFNGSGKTVWVIDSGVDLDHPDLVVDRGRSANFVARGKNSPDDKNGHGTHVAGTIAAKDDGYDVIGVAAGATVVAVRVLDASGSGSISGVIAGIDFVASAAAPGDVANMSLGASGHFQSLHDAVMNAAGKGIMFSIAAGNDSAHANGFEPAHVEHPNVLTISAVDSSDRLASFSNYGNPPVDFAAPGVSILSTKMGGGTTSMSGTSMAAPHVAGLLLFGQPNPDGTAQGDPDGNPDPIARR